MQSAINTGKIDKLTKNPGKLNPSNILTKGVVREDLKRHHRAMWASVVRVRSQTRLWWSKLLEGFSRQRPYGALLEWNAWEVWNVSTKLVLGMRNL